MTTPPDAPEFGHPSTWPVAAEQSAPAPRPRRAGLIAALAGGALLLMAATGVSVWLLTRPGSKAPAPDTSTSSAPALNPVTVSGELVLQRGQFMWQSAADPTCSGLNGYSDLTAGAQVTVTDAAGKALAVGSLQRGVAEGITTDGRATTCSLRFAVSGVPGGAGPYGVEVAHRGVVRFNEGELLGSIRLQV